MTVVTGVEISSSSSSSSSSSPRNPATTTTRSLSSSSSSNNNNNNRRHTHSSTARGGTDPTQHHFHRHHDAPVTPTTVVDMSEVSTRLSVLHAAKQTHRLTSDEATQPTTVSDHCSYTTEEDYDMQSQSFRTLGENSVNDPQREEGESTGSNRSSSSTTSSVTTQEDLDPNPITTTTTTSTNNTIATNTIATNGAERRQQEQDDEQEEQIRKVRDHGTLRPHGPTPPIIKAYDIRQIPTNAKRNAWLTLKAPPSLPPLSVTNGDADAREYLSRGRSSIEASRTPVQQQQQPKSSSLKKEGEGKRVTFVAVQIRDYEQTIGDNPSVSYGPPISLDWGYEARDALPLDLYEADRLGKRRTLRQMMLNYYHRTHLLGACLGYTEAELAAAQRAAERVRGQRTITKATLAVSKFEEAWQSTKRKLMNKKGKKKQRSE